MVAHGNPVANREDSDQARRWPANLQPMRQNLLGVYRSRRNVRLPQGTAGFSR
jgi:hypothetical protein